MTFIFIFILYNIYFYIIFIFIKFGHRPIYGYKSPTIAANRNYNDCRRCGAQKLIIILAVVFIIERVGLTLSRL